MKTIQKQKRGMQTMLKSKRKRKEVFDTVLYTLPAIVLVTMMMYIPFIMSGYYSLTKWNGIAKDAEFIGLDNFVTIFSKSKEFSNALIFTGKYTLLFIIFSNVLALFLAVCLRQWQAQGLYRILLIFPHILLQTPGADSVSHRLLLSIQVPLLKALWLRVPANRS